MPSKKIGGRVWEVETQIVHPETKKPILTPAEAKGVLESYLSIKRYAYIVHDKDYLTKEEIIEKFYGNRADLSDEEIEQITKDWQEKKYKRTPHIHVVFETPNNYFDVMTVAKWFGVEPNFVRVKKGRGAFLDCVQYLTHEDEKQQDLGKYRYSDNEVKANFDWRKAITDSMREKEKYGKSLTARERLQMAVLQNGMTLKEAINLDPYNYNKDLNILKRNRHDYLSRQSPPCFRMNIYICGDGGTGKDLMARAIARSLIGKPLDCHLDDDEIYFEIGAKNVEFEYYDGQPVVIWNDVRSRDLVSRWGRDNLFGSIMEPYPSNNKKQNVKYSSVSLINWVNIFTGPEKYTDFLNGLVGIYESGYGYVNYHESENRDQSYRRFPMIIPIYKEDFDILLNDGYINDNRNWTQYIVFNSVKGSFAKLHSRLPGNGDKVREIEGQMVGQITDHIKRISEKNKVFDEDELKEIVETEFGDYGKELDGQQSLFSLLDCDEDEDDDVFVVGSKVFNEDEDDDEKIDFSDLEKYIEMNSNKNGDDVEKEDDFKIDVDNIDMDSVYPF